MVSISLCFLPHNAQQQHSVMENVCKLIYAQYILQRSSLFNKRSKQLFSSVHLEGTEKYFFVVHYCFSYFNMLGLFLTTTTSMMESREFVLVSRPIFASLGLEGFRSRLGLEDFRSRDFEYCKETVY